MIFQPYAVFNYKNKRNTVDSLSLPAINGNYMTAIFEDRNDLLNLLPGDFPDCSAGRGDPNSLVISLSRRHRVGKGQGG